MCVCMLGLFSFVLDIAVLMLQKTRQWLTRVGLPVLKRPDQGSKVKASDKVLARLPVGQNRLWTEQ